MSSTLNVYNKQQFNADVSFNSNATFNNTTTQITSSGSVNIANTNTVIKSTGLVNISGGIVNISGDAININGQLSIGNEFINSWNNSAFINNGNVGFGLSSSVSSDGNIIVVGAYDSNKVFIYTKESGSSWTGTPTPTVTLTGPIASSWFGISVAISNDGNTISIGASLQNKLYIYTKSSGSSWTGTPTETTVINGSGSDGFAYAHGLSGDGTIIVAGASNRLFIFTRSGSWSSTPSLTLANASWNLTSNLGGYLGYGVSISNDGNTVMTSAVELNKAFLYRKSSGSNWSGNVYEYAYSTSNSNATFTGTGRFSNSMAMSDDGNTVVIGATDGSKAYIYTISSGSSWSKTPTLTSTITCTAGYAFGMSAAVSIDGTTVVIGAHSSLNPVNNITGGAVYIYNKSVNWDTNINANSATKIFYPSTAGSLLGFSVCISYDGNTIVGCGLGEKSAYIYNYSASINTSINKKINIYGNKLDMNSDGYHYLQSKSNSTFTGPMVVGYLGGSLGQSSAVASGLDFKPTLTWNGNNVGIGTTNPQFPLHIATSGASPTNYYLGTGGTSYTTNESGMVAYTYFNIGSTYYLGQAAYNGYYGRGWGLFVKDSILAAEIDAYSDSRIKMNIVDIDDENALSILRQIKPKTYDYIDKLQKGNSNVIGFIAQEIKAIIPKAVKINTDYPPTFYTLCQISSTDISNIVLVTSPIDLSWNPLHDQSGNEFVDSAGNASSDASGNKVFNVKIYDQYKNEIKCKTTTILDKRSFLMDISGSKISDGALHDGYFLYGQEIDDFHTLDKNAIFTVVTAAVQDIDRIQQTHASQIQSQEAKINALEQQVASLQSQIQSQNAAFEARLASLESK